jgi:hypothetical protein
MTISTGLTINEAQIFTVLRNFVLSILPTDVECVKGQINRVAEPSSVNFVSMTPLFQSRLATNVDDYVETIFVGNIVGNTLVVETISSGRIFLGGIICGAGIALGTVVTGFGSGHGGVGNYTVNFSQNVSSEAMQTGAKTAEQYTQLTMQLDVHGPDSANNSQIISTLFRDEYATDFFYASGLGMAPLYSSDPRQVPFINGEQQYEYRWSVDAVMQVNPVVTVSQQFAVALGPVDVVDVI